MNNAVACAPLHTGYTVYAKLVAVSCLWGGTFVAGRYLSTDVAPLLSASVRFVRLRPARPGGAFKAAPPGRLRIGRISAVAGAP